MSEHHPASGITRLLTVARMEALTQSDPYTRVGMCAELIKEGQADLGEIAVGALNEMLPLAHLVPAPYLQKEVTAYSLIDVLADAGDFPQAERCIDVLRAHKRASPVIIGISHMLRKGYAGVDYQYASLHVRDMVDAHAEKAELHVAIASYAAGLAGYGLNVLDGTSYAAHIFNTSIQLLPESDRQEQYRTVATAYVDSGFTLLAQDVAERMSDPFQRGKAYAAIAARAHQEGKAELATESIRMATAMVMELNDRRQQGGAGKPATPNADALDIGADIALLLAKRGQSEHARLCAAVRPGLHGDHGRGLVQAQTWAELYSASGSQLDRTTALQVFDSANQRAIPPQKAGDFFGAIAAADRRNGHLIEIPDDNSAVPIMCLEMADHQNRAFRDAGFVALVKEVAVSAPQTARHMIDLIKTPKYRVRAMAALAQSVRFQTGPPHSTEPGE